MFGTSEGKKKYLEFINDQMRNIFNNEMLKYNNKYESR